jgi:hypothetical protein
VRGMLMAAEAETVKEMGLSAFMIASCAASAAKHFNLPLPANLPI